MTSSQHDSSLAATVPTPQRGVRHDGEFAARLIGVRLRRRDGRGEEPAMNVSSLHDSSAPGSVAGTATVPTAAGRSAP